MADFAVIRTGNKQYKVSPGVTLRIEKLEGEKGASVSFPEVLLRTKGDSIEVGAPHVAGAKVEGKILRQARSRKVIVFKYHSKARYRKKKGHRQFFTEVEITKI